MVGRNLLNEKLKKWEIRNRGFLSNIFNHHNLIPTLPSKWYSSSANLINNQLNLVLKDY